MTFILAIQLEDSAIVATDHKYAIPQDDGSIKLCEGKLEKMYFWESGMLTGTGEHYVTERAFQFFKVMASSDIQKLPECLEISRRIRTLEIGTDYRHIQTTKLLCSRFTEQGAQLYTINRFDLKDDYSVTSIEPMRVLLWMFNPDVSAVTSDLQHLFDHLKNYTSFKSLNEWFEYYIHPIAQIFKKQNQYDAFMTESFDIFFQNKENYYSGFISNGNTKITKISIS